MTFDKGLNINIGHDGSLRLMVTDFSQLGYHLLQVLSASFAICKALVLTQILAEKFEGRVKIFLLK